MVSLFLYIFGLCVAIGACAWTATSDFKKFQIPNAASVLMVIGFVLAYGGSLLILGESTLPFHSVKSHILSFVIIFIVTFVMFAVRAIGAGDAKFAAACSVWFGGQGALMFIFYMSLAGGLLGIATLMLARIKPLKGAVIDGTSWIASAQGGNNRVPYGIALAAGFIVAAAQMGYFDIIAIQNVRSGGG